jgi:undecaprenyl-diphosphatase
MCAIVIAIIAYAKLKDKAALKKVAILALIALLFSDLIVLCLKHLVHAPRPFMTLDNVNLLISEDDPFSFPSGHAASTFAVIGIFVMTMKDLVKRHCHLINLAIIIFAVLIPISRMYVGVHYPGDVIAGAGIGIFGALTIKHFKEKILNII